MGRNTDGHDNQPATIGVREHMEIAADSFATHPAGVDASMVRLLRHEKLNRNWFVLTLVLAAVTIAVAAAAYWCFDSPGGGWRTVAGIAAAVVAAVLALVTLVAGLVVLRMVYVMKESFRSGALLPAVVVSVDPVHYLAMTDLSTGADDLERWAVKRIEVPSLPGATPAVGMRIACAGNYTPGPDEASWADFAPCPIHWATADPAVIADRVRAVAEADFVRLEKVIRSGKVPTEPLQVVRYGAAKARAARRG